MKSFPEYKNDLREKEKQHDKELADISKDVKKDYTEYSTFLCPVCSGIAVDGDPKKKTKTKGSAKCLECKKGFTVFNMKPSGVLSFQ